MKPFEILRSFLSFEDNIYYFKHNSVCSLGSPVWRILHARFDFIT